MSGIEILFHDLNTNCIKFNLFSGRQVFLFRQATGRQKTVGRNWAQANLLASYLVQSAGHRVAKFLPKSETFVTRSFSNVLLDRAGPILVPCRVRACAETLRKGRGCHNAQDPDRKTSIWYNIILQAGADC